MLLADDVHAQLDALVADEHRRAGDELAHFVLALAAERAIERLGIASADLAHPCSPSIANAGALEPFIRNVRLVSPDGAIFQAAGQDPAGQSLAAGIERDDCGIFGNCGGKPCGPPSRSESDQVR